MPLIFIVDDYENAVAAVMRALRTIPAEIRGFARPEEALAAAAETPPDVLVSDFFMPELTGAELAARMHALQPALITVLITTQDRCELVGLDEVPGVVELVRKPWPARALPDAVRRALDLVPRAIPA